MTMPSAKQAMVASGKLHSNPFSGLAPEAVAQPAFFYPAGAEIYGQGEKAYGIYQVEFGCVRVYRLLADGRRQISGFNMSGDIFGFETDGTHHSFAEAVSATGAHVIRLTTVGDASEAVLPLVLQGLIRAQEHLLVLGRQNAVERIAAFLMDMAERQGGLEVFDLPMPRSDIADYLGLTIETVSRVFSKLKRKGIIRLPSIRSVEIKKWEVLQGMSE